MIEQLALEEAPRVLSPVGRVLTDRQQFVFDLVRNTPGGITADEVGAALHASQGRHSADVRCQWDARDGSAVLRSKAVAPLVVRRRLSGMWEPREQQPAPPAPELPGETWEDLFT